MGPSGLEFNIQDEFATLRRERKEDHDDLSGKLDRGFDSLEMWARNHELMDQERFGSMANRLEPLEAIHKTVRSATKWLVLAIMSPVIYSVVMEHIVPWLRRTL